MTMALRVQSHDSQRTARQKLLYLAPAALAVALVLCPLAGLLTGLREWFADTRSVWNHRPS